MENSVSGIYVITNNVNDKKYVGQSYDLERRFRAHRNELRRGDHGNSHLQAAWNKYGEHSFSFEVIEYCPIDDLDTREMYWIRCLDAFSSNGYNMTIGGNGARGYHMSDEAKLRLSESMKQNPTRYWQGKHLSDEHKEKLRERAKNRSEEYLRKIGEASRRTMANPEIKQRMILHQNNKAVRCVELGEVFYSMSEAARRTGASAGNISKVCHGVIKTTGGYHWEFVDARRGTP